MIHCWLSAHPERGIKSNSVDGTRLYIHNWIKQEADSDICVQMEPQTTHVLLKNELYYPWHTRIFWFIFSLNSLLWNKAAVLMCPWRCISIKWTTTAFTQNCTNCCIKATTLLLHLKPLISERDIGATSLRFPEPKSASGWQVFSCFPRKVTKDQVDVLKMTREFTYFPRGCHFFRNLVGHGIPCRIPTGCESPSLLITFITRRRVKWKSQ